MKAELLTTLVVWMGLAQGWQLVMKVPRGGDLGPARSVYDLWTANITLNEDHDNALNVQPGIPFKSRDILDWDSKRISLVKLAFYSAGETVAEVVFNVAGPSYNHTDWPMFDEGTNITSWFDCQRIIYSTWPDLVAQTTPEVCSIHTSNTVEQSFSVVSSQLISQSDCDNMTGWFTVLEPDSINSVVKCDWQPTAGSPPHFLFSSESGPQHFSEARTADVFAVFVDDCIDEDLCHHEDCWQDPLGECHCNGYKCIEMCSRLPCAVGETCVTDPKNNSLYTCECEHGYEDNVCIDPVYTEPEGIGGGAIAGIVIGLLIFIGLVVLAVWFLYRWRIKKDPLKQEMTHKAVLAKDFVRRSVHRLSGRNHQFPRHHLKEEKASPIPNPKNKSEQLSPDSSVVFGSTNPAFMSEELPTPTPTPPVDRRYTEFPTRQGGATPATVVSTSELKLHEQKQADIKASQPTTADVHAHKQYVNVPFPQTSELRSSDTSHHLDCDRASTIGSFEKASTMSEMSDATSTSGFSDYAVDTPANLPPSEMISKDMKLRHGHHRHKARPRPRSRASTADHPKSLMAQPTIEGQIKYAMERSRLSVSSMSSLSSDATHRSDATQRSGELTKSDVLRTRYENISGQIVDPAVDLPRLYVKNNGNYVDIKKQLDEDMSRREARERKRELELEHEGSYDLERERQKRSRIRQVESLDSGIDAENSADRYPDGRLQIVRARSADELDSDGSIRYTSSAREATV